jgi:hypothetical protein
MRFYVGLHQPSDARHIARSFISWRRLLGRKKPLGEGEKIIDSGAFTEIAMHGGYRADVAGYAAEINRWASIEGDRLVAAVSQDYMCEPAMLERTGLTIERHQELTIERYDALRALVSAVYIMPVLQGYAPADYVRHVEMYGERLSFGAYVGVGSICKRNGTPVAVERVLGAIKAARPDLRLHGFGLKTTALEWATVRDLLFSGDSMAWSYAARREGRNPNCWREAASFSRRIETQAVQLGWVM